jgi:hypothetical protein
MGNTYTFSDELISTVAKLLQLAMLTGTDIYDHMRTVQVTNSDDGKLVLSADFKQKLEQEVERLMGQAAQLEADSYGLVEADGGN